MREDIKAIFKSAEDEYNNLDFSNVVEENLINITIKIKHILEDLRSTLDYIANDIYYKYNTCSNQKIYFPYAKREQNEELFEKQFQRNLPNVKEKNIQIYRIVKKIQSFNNEFWLINLIELTNNIKHVKLRINKVKLEKHTTATDGKIGITVVGDTSIRKIGGEQYGIFGEGQVFVGGTGQVLFYSDGIIKIGDGTYNIEDKSMNNLQVNECLINKLVFTEWDNIESKVILKDIIEGIKKLINDIEEIEFNRITN